MRKAVATDMAALNKHGSAFYMHFSSLPVRRAVVLIQVAPLRVAKDYGSSSLKH